MANKPIHTIQKMEIDIEGDKVDPPLNYHYPFKNQNITAAVAQWDWRGETDLAEDWKKWLPFILGDEGWEASF